MLRSLASYKSLEEIENRPVTPTVKLKDIARIKYEEPEKRYSVRVNSRPAVAAVIFKEGEANTVEVSRRIREEFEEMKKNPRLASLYMEVLFNQGSVIEESLHNLVESGIVGGVLAALILFVFLRRFRLTGIITLSIPLSLLIALAVMFFAHESLNVLTILALVIAVGMLVDDSIVVAENIQRFHNNGLPRREACIRGAGEIALAIMMSTLTTIVVFVPVALVEGQGQFFLMRLALPLSVSVVASLFVALAFVPLSVYITLPANDAKKRHVAFRWSHAKINAVMARFYDLTFERMNRFYVGIGFLPHATADLVLILLGILPPHRLALKIEVVEQQEEERTDLKLRRVSNEYSFEEIGEYFSAAEKVLAEGQCGLRGYLCSSPARWADRRLVRQR